MPAVVSCPLCGIDRWDGIGPCSTCGGLGTQVRCDGSGLHADMALTEDGLSITCHVCGAVFDTFDCESGAAVLPTHTREKS